MRLSTPENQAYEQRLAWNGLHYTLLGIQVDIGQPDTCRTQLRSAESIAIHVDDTTRGTEHDTSSIVGGRPLFTA